MNLESLKRFVGKEVRLTKKESKRPNWSVEVGHVSKGEFNLHFYPATGKLPEALGAEVVGNGFQFTRTSPIVKVVDESENSAIFETEGGVYVVETLKKEDQSGSN